MLRWRAERWSSSSAAMARSSCAGRRGVNTLRFTCVCTTVASTSATPACPSALTERSGHVGAGEDDEVDDDDEGVEAGPGDVYVVYWGVMKKSGKGAGAAVGGPAAPPGADRRVRLRFSASKDCSSCSSSFTKSMAPPITDAWSPWSVIVKQKNNT